MYIYIYNYLYIHIYLHLYIHIRIPLYIQLYIYIYIHTYIHTSIFVVVYIHICIHLFHKEVENIKQALINNGFPNYIVDKQIKRMIKNVNQQNKQCTIPSSQQTYIKLFLS